MLAYLGAYTHRIAISNHRILSVEQNRVAFRYRDSADGKKQNVMHLDVHEFIRRFLLHVLPKGFVQTRHYGLLAKRNRKEKIERCPACGEGRMAIVAEIDQSCRPDEAH